MLKFLLVLSALWPSNFAQIFGDEPTYTVNTKRALHSVSERFLSISLDPAVLLTGLNLSDTSLKLAQRFGPAYIRIAGPSTEFVKYVNDEGHSSESNNNVVVTPSMWFGINEWLTLANLTPVFGINDVETTSKGVWNPKSAMPLLEISDQLNVTCFWQLGYDCSNKSEARYKDDLLIFRHILDAFPDKRDVWRIIGSDFSKCSNNLNFEHTRRILDGMKDSATAVVWETGSDYQTQKHILSMPLKPKIDFWTVAPKDSHTVSFSSAISWAQQIGEAARTGYQVMFRQPRMHEILSDSPAYWVSVMHKVLMGRNVLDVKSTHHTPQVSLYAHCSRHQNNFIRSGAMTILMVNNASVEHTVFVRFGTGSLKNTEVQSYILTSTSEESTDVYLNEEKLTLGAFDGDKLNISPKHRRAKVMNYLSLSLPPKSIGFFVLPTARVPVCVTGETETKLLMDEIRGDQNIPFSDEEISVDVAPRLGLSNRRPTLRELQNIMEKELESDENYYRSVKTPKFKPLVPPEVSLKDARNFFIERAKLADRQRKLVDNDHKRLQLFRDKYSLTHDEPEKDLELELELTSAEIRKVLSDRARVKAAKKNIVFSSQELEEIMNKATDKFLNNKHTMIKIKRKSKRETMRDKKDINMKLLQLKTLGDKRKSMLQQMHQMRRPNIYNNHKRQRRDINFNLLKLKTELLDNKNQKSADDDGIFASGESLGKSSFPEEDVYPDLEKTPERSRMRKIQPSVSQNLLNILKPKKLKPTIQDLSKSSIFDSDFDSLDNLDDLPCIHEYFGLDSLPGGGKSKLSGILEIGEEKVRYNFPVSVNNKGLDTIFENDYSGLDSDDSSIKVKRSVDDGRHYYVIGKAYDRANDIKIDDNLKEQQIKLLKLRLANKKRLESANKSNNDKVLNKRSTRSIQDETENSLDGRYKSLSDGLRSWKPSDMINLGDKRKFVRSPNIKSMGEADKQIHKRSVDDSINSIENEIDSFMNEINKDTRIVAPKVDFENGDYQLVFPNKDRIEVLEKVGDTELKLVLHGQEEEVDNGTCAPTEQPEINNNYTGTKNLSHVQKIPVHKYAPSVWDEVFRKIVQFFQGVTKKIKCYILKDVLD